jgi:hypothetical protein
LVGRSLDHQKYFHDVNYEHRLRDSAHELYQFKEQHAMSKRKLVLDTDMETDQEESYLPNGVFTLLTDCYSPTCTADSMCYSALCPRRFNQVNNYNVMRQSF